MPTKRKPNKRLVNFLYVLADKHVPIGVLKALVDADEVEVDPNLKKLFEDLALKLTPASAAQVESTATARNAQKEK